MGTHRLHRATALVTLTLLGLTACSPDGPAPRTQSSVTTETTDEATDDTTAGDDPMTFMAPDRSSNDYFGLSADGPERADVHGSYRQAAIADDSRLFQYSPDVVSPDLQSVYLPDEIAAAQQTAVTFLVQEYIDSELVADASPETRVVAEARLRSQLAPGDFWDVELPPALAAVDCTYLVDCKSSTRDPVLGRTLAGGSDLRFILTDFATAEIYLGEEDMIVVRLAAGYRRELDVPGREHMFESTTVSATYGLSTSGAAWFLDGWEVQADPPVVGALVDGGQPALPMLDGVDWGTVPTGFTEQTFEGVDYALGTAWEPGGEEAWAWNGAGDDGDVVFEPFVGPVLDSTGERANLAAILVPKEPGAAGGMSDAEWVLPLDGASFRIDVPGAISATGEFRPVTDDDRERVDIWIETDDAYVWFTAYADPGEGEALLRELAETITVP